MTIRFPKAEVNIQAACTKDFIEAGAFYKSIVFKIRYFFKSSKIMYFVKFKNYLTCEYEKSRPVIANKTSPTANKKC